MQLFQPNQSEYESLSHEKCDRHHKKIEFNRVLSAKNLKLPKKVSFCRQKLVSLLIELTMGHYS